MLETGKIPGNTEGGDHPTKHHPKEGDLYFYSIDSRNFRKQSVSIQEYSQLIAQAHKLLTLLDLPLDSQENMSAAQAVFHGSGNYDEGIETFAKLGFTQAKIDKQRELARVRKGIIIGIGFNENIRYPILSTENPDEDSKINDPDGFPLEIIHGLNILTKEEIIEFKRLIFSKPFLFSAEK